MCFATLVDGVAGGEKWLRWKDVKVFQEIELGAGRALTQCGLAKNQRQDSVVSCPTFTVVHLYD